MTKREPPIPARVPMTPYRIPRELLAGFKATVDRLGWTYTAAIEKAMELFIAYAKTRKE